MSVFLIRTYYTSSIVGTLLAAVCLSVSFGTYHWEHVYYDLDKLQRLTRRDQNFDITIHDQYDDENGYFEVRLMESENGLVNNSSYPSWMFVAMRQIVSLWEICDTIHSKYTL